MATMLHVLAAMVVFGFMVEVCSASCSPQPEDDIQSCMGNYMVEANYEYHLANTSKNPDYTEFCRIMTKTVECMNPHMECTPMKLRNSRANAMTQFNQAPFFCKLKDINGVEYEFCMPSHLGHCDGQTATIIAAKTQDESVPNSVYLMTCPLVRDYKKCYDEIEGCSGNVLDKIKKSIQPYRNYSTYDCFPGEHEPIGICRGKVQELSCVQRYSSELMDWINIEIAARAGFTRTCGILQKLYDCLVIKASGCSFEELERDLSYPRSSAATYNCAIDECSRLWRGCTEKFTPVLSDTPSNQLCGVVEEFAQCARFAVNNSCPYGVSNAVIKTFTAYPQCTLKPIVEKCDTDAIIACETNNNPLNIIPGSVSSCDTARKYYTCVKPLLTAKCTKDFRTRREQIFAVLEAAPYNCDIKCPMDDVNKCKKTYLDVGGLVYDSEISDGKADEYVNTCKYVKDYLNCAQSAMVECNADTKGRFIEKVKKYQIDTDFGCYEGKWCNKGQMNSCTSTLNTKIAELANVAMSQSDLQVFCGHVKTYQSCVHPILLNCPRTMSSDYMNVTAKYGTECKLGPTTTVDTTEPSTMMMTTECVDTCGVGSVTSLPLAVVMATLCAILGRH